MSPSGKAAAARVLALLAVVLGAACSDRSPSAASGGEDAAAPRSDAASPADGASSDATVGDATSPFDAASQDASPTDVGPSPDGPSVEAGGPPIDASDAASGEADTSAPGVDAGAPGPTLADYWSTNAFGQPAAKWQLEHMLTYPNGGILATSFDHIVIGPKGRCANGASPWWSIHGGAETTDATCMSKPGTTGWGTAVSLSCDQGTTWSADVQAVPAAAGHAWACFATDGRMLYDAPAATWHFLFQCMGEDGVWNGCHLQTSGDPDGAGWAMGPGQTTNPVILGGAPGVMSGQLWGAICQPGDRCGGETWIGNEGTFDIIQKDAAGYFWIDFHGLGSSGNLYRGIARTADFVSYQTNGTGGTPTDSVFDVPTQMAAANGVNEAWPGYAAGGAGTIVQDGAQGLYYLFVENIDDNRDLTNPNTDPSADKKWDLSLGRQTSLGSSSWDWSTLPQGNPIFLSPYDSFANAYPTWMGGSDCYPYLFFDPSDAVWHLMACREQNGSINGSAPVLYRLVFTGNALPDGDFNTRPGASGNGNWQRLAVAGGTVNFSVYRVPYAASDDQQFLETNTSTAGGSVYEDVASLTALASKPAAFGGKVRAAAGSTGTIVVFEYDASGNVLGQLQQAFTATGPGGWTGTWQSVAYSGGATFAPALDHVRFQMYLGTTGTNFDFDEMYLNAP